MKLGDLVEATDCDGNYTILKFVQQGGYIVALDCNLLPAGEAVPAGEIKGDLALFLERLINPKLFKIRKLNE